MCCLTTDCTLSKCNHSADWSLFQLFSASLLSLLWGVREIVSALKCLIQFLLFSGRGSWARMIPRDTCQSLWFITQPLPVCWGGKKRQNFGLSSCLEVCTCVCMACKHAYIGVFFSSLGKYISDSYIRWLYITVISFFKRTVGKPAHSIY